MNPPEIKTLKNIEAALAGESMAHVKYRYFAQIARAQGDEETAQIFEETAAQEVLHAIGHLELLHPRATLTPEICLKMAIAGETHEYTEMYPSFRQIAVEEGQFATVEEMDEQIAESKEHAALFKATLEKAAKRFAALAKVEERHAQQYQAVLSHKTA